MQRTSFATMECPVAHALEHVGDLWGMLIVRDALHGKTRFDEFQRSLGISTSSLTRRLNELVAAGVLERRPYSEHPPRSEYVLTPAGQDLKPVVIALAAWGQRHDPPATNPVIVVDATTGERIDPAVIDLHSGRDVRDPEIVFRSNPDPTATEAARRALEHPPR
jgi:DNA-binding HxlR family transcriptional regulator